MSHATTNTIPALHGGDTIVISNPATGEQDIITISMASRITAPDGETTTLHVHDDNNKVHELLGDTGWVIGQIDCPHDNAMAFPAEMPDRCARCAWDKLLEFPPVETDEAFMQMPSAADK